jgi:hypothetical protein
MRRGYYVSAISGPRYSIVAGPFRTHAKALASVESLRAKWAQLDVRAQFAAWGTCRVGFATGAPCGCPVPHNLDASLPQGPDAEVVEPVDPSEKQFVGTKPLRGRMARHD